MELETSKKSLRGFASMDKAKQKEIASKGGRAAHERGTAHEFDTAEAANAARKGHERGTAHEFTSEEARIAGRKGGIARAANRAASRTTEGEVPTLNVPNSNPPETSINGSEGVESTSQRSTVQENNML